MSPDSPVVGGIRTAREVFAHLVCRTVAEYEDLQRRMMALNRSRDRIRADPTVLVAYVNEGRLLVDCLCQNGLPVLMPARLARCIECGRTYTAIAVPAAADYRALEALLARRPEAQRHWDPRRGETIATLRAENAAHGIAEEG